VGGDVDVARAAVTGDENGLSGQKGLYVAEPSLLLGGIERLGCGHISAPHDVAVELQQERASAGGREGLRVDARPEGGQRPLDGVVKIGSEAGRSLPFPQQVRDRRVIGRVLAFVTQEEGAEEGFNQVGAEPLLEAEDELLELRPSPDVLILPSG
jgi:hypothetical protein